MIPHTNTDTDYTCTTTVTGTNTNTIYEIQNTKYKEIPITIHDHIMGHSLWSSTFYKGYLQNVDYWGIQLSFSVLNKREIKYVFICFWCMVHNILSCK